MHNYGMHTPYKISNKQPNAVPGIWTRLQNGVGGMVLGDISLYFCQWVPGYEKSPMCLATPQEIT